MIKRAIRAIVAVGIAATMAVSCAKEVTNDMGAIEQASLDEWVKLHAPNAKPLADGIYYEELKPAPAGAEELKGGYWLQVNYDIKDLNGNAAYTRSEETVKRLGTYSKYTHYVPDMMFFGTKASSSTMPVAMFHALQGMKIGAVGRIYSTSKHVFDSRGLNNSIGYGGQSALAAGYPAIIDNIEVVESFYNPDVRERDLISQLVTGAAPEGWEMSETDSLKSHLFMQRLNPENEEKGNEVIVGSTAWIYYKAMFLDGTLLDTNIDSVWVNRFGAKRYKTNQMGMSVPVEDTMAVAVSHQLKQPISADMPKRVFDLVFETDKPLYYNDSLRMVVASSYAYGDAGRVGYVGYKTTYKYDAGYYGRGGYAGLSGIEGKNRYDSAIANFYYLYNVPATTAQYPIAEVKFFTPIIYEFVVREAN